MENNTDLDRIAQHRQRSEVAAAYSGGFEATPYTHYADTEIGEEAGPTAEVLCRDGYALVITPIEGRTALSLSIDPEEESLTFTDYQVIAAASVMLGALANEDYPEKAKALVFEAMHQLRLALEELAKSQMVEPAPSTSANW